MLKLLVEASVIKGQKVKVLSELQVLSDTKRYGSRLPCSSSWLEEARIVYSSPPGSNCVKIYSKSMLHDFHKKGRLLDVSTEQLVFTTKRKPKQKNYQTAEKKLCLSDEKDLNMEDLCSTESMDICQEASVNEMEVQSDTRDVPAEEIVASIDYIKEKQKLEKEQTKLTEAVLRLTISPHKQVDHKKVLEDTAKRLSDVRLSDSVARKEFDMAGFKELVMDCKTVEDMSRILWQDSWFQSKFSDLFTSRLLEQLLALNSVPENPLKAFPVDVNTNVYADIVNFAIDNAQDVILLLTSLTKKFESPVSTSDVISLAFSFSSLAENASSHNKAIKKTKSVCLRSSGLTNSGLDSLSAVGVVETSRSYRNDRDLLASISEEILKQYAKQNVAQFTFDNCDIQINNIPHHLT